MNYETCEIEIIPVTDVVTSSGGIFGDEDDFGYGNQYPHNEVEW